MTNHALDVNTNYQNGKHVAIGITMAGSDFYYAVCAIMGTVAIGVISAGMLKPRSHRIFFHITAAINITACVAYFTMGSNLGWTPIDVEYMRSGNVAGTNRAIFYARYVDWFVTTPLLIMDLLLTAGLPMSTIIWAIFMDWVMIVTGLVGALVKSEYKWGFYTFGCIAMFYLFWIIAFEGRTQAARIDRTVHRTYVSCGVLTLFIWLVYPIAWGVSEGGNVIAPDSEAVFYGILDLCAKPLFSIMLIIGHWNIDPATLGLRISDAADKLNDIKNSSTTGRDPALVTSEGAEGSRNGNP